jgi:WASH complex subunit strumpellin
MKILERFYTLFESIH